MEDKVYWKTREGKILDVDLMTSEHIKNAFKMVIKNNSHIGATEEDVNNVYLNYLKANILPLVFGYNSTYNIIKGKGCDSCAPKALEPLGDWDDYYA